MSLPILFVLAPLVVAACVMVARAVKGPRHPWRLNVQAHAEWSTLEAPAPAVPRLLFAPHAAPSAVRCYDARVHGPSGQRVSIGVFEAPGGLDAILFIGMRLLFDSDQLLQSSTQPISIGGVSGIGRTGWIRGENPDGTGTAYAHIAFLFPEQNTPRVHFASTIIPVDEGQLASTRMQALLHGARFDGDDGAVRATVSL